MGSIPHTKLGSNNCNISWCSYIHIHFQRSTWFYSIKKPRNNWHLWRGGWWEHWWQDCLSWTRLPDEPVKSQTQPFWPTRESRSIIHQSIMGNDKYPQGQTCISSFKGYGLFIHRVSRAKLVEVQIDRPSNMGIETWVLGPNSFIEGISSSLIEPTKSNLVWLDSRCPTVLRACTKPVHSRANKLRASAYEFSGSVTGSIAQQVRLSHRWVSCSYLLGLGVLANWQIQCYKIL